MRSVARWSLVLALCCAVVCAAAQPAWQHAAQRAADATAAGSDAPADAGGFTSQAPPQDRSYIGPGAAVAGSTVLSARCPASSFVTTRLTRVVGNAASHACDAPRLSPHLRSIPLLI